MIADLKPYPEYKESGSQWLGAVPAKWDVRNLRTLISKRAERDRADLPLLSVAREKGVFVRSLTDADENHNVIPDDLSNYKMARAGNLVINKMKAWQGSMGIAPCDGIVSPAYFVFDFRIANHAFGQRLLRSKPYVAHFGQASDGVRVGQWDLSIPGMRQIPVLVPPPVEQAAIVRFLDWANGRLERAIRAKRKVIALLNEQKQGIIHRAVTGGLDASVPLKPSGIPWLGDIPQHWEVRRLKSVLVGQLTNGVFKRGDAFGSGVPLVNVSDIYTLDGRIHKERLDRVQVTAKEVETFRIHTGDLCFVRSSLKLEGTGRCAFVESVDPGTVFECHVVRARPDLLIIEPRFLAMFLGSWAGVHNTVSRANTVTMSTLGQGAINSLPIIVPPLVEQRGILGLVDAESSPLANAISRLEREIELLREYRTRFVADVVTGKLDVREAAARLPDEAALDTAENDTDLRIDPEAADEEAAV